MNATLWLSSLSRQVGWQLQGLKQCWMWNLRVFTREFLLYSGLQMMCKNTLLVYRNTRRAAKDFPHQIFFVYFQSPRKALPFKIVDSSIYHQSLSENPSLQEPENSGILFLLAGKCKNLFILIYVGQVQRQSHDKKKLLTLCTINKGSELCQYPHLIWSFTFDITWMALFATGFSHQYLQWHNLDSLSEAFLQMFFILTALRRAEVSCYLKQYF